MKDPKKQRRTQTDKPGKPAKAKPRADKAGAKASKGTDAKPGKTSAAKTKRPAVTAKDTDTKRPDAKRLGKGKRPAGGKGGKLQDALKPGKDTKPRGGVKPGKTPKPQDTLKPGTRPKPKDGLKPGKDPKPQDGFKPGKDPDPQDGFKPGHTPKPDDALKPGDRAKVVKNPLLMMPMRLEYRVVREEDKLQVVARSERADKLLEWHRKLVETKPDDKDTIAEIQHEIDQIMGNTGPRKLHLEKAKLEGDTEIWMRWYPDDSFAEDGIAPPSEEESKALAAFLAHPQSRDWPKLGEGEMTALWAEFAAVAGDARAVHLMRNQQASEDPYWEHRIGRIAGLPQRVAVFALYENELVLLGEGADIPANTDWGAGLVSYSPAAIEDSAWVSDFNVALDLGMGLKLSDSRAIEIALKADWLICVGLSGTDDTADLTKLLEDQIASGRFELMHQDTPTNNTPAALARADTGDTVIARLGAHTKYDMAALQSGGLGCELLGSALAVEPKMLMQAKGADEDGQLNAAAMIRVIGPALMDGSLAATPIMNNVEDTDFIELLAQHVQAGGVLPGLKFGSSAYGVVPISDEQTKPDGNYDLTSDEKDYEEFIRTYSGHARQDMVTHSRETTLRLEPDDPDASEKVTDILQTSRVSRRVDVSDEADDKIAGLGCPYVSGDDEKFRPASYLIDLSTVPVRDLVKPDESDMKWPLLYRLAHLSITRNREIEVLKGSSGFVSRGKLRLIQGNWMASLSPQQRNAINQSRQYSLNGFNDVPANALNRIPGNKRLPLKAVNRRYTDALTRLRAIATQPDGTAHLETLMMEVIDLFQHRLDAWVTGLASIRLKRLRQDFPDTGLRLGYFGVLGQLRTRSATGAGDGYIQAPSQGQAVTAAILRSAFLRNRAEGAFKINLSSRRTTRALRIMDHIRHGVALPECLGLRGERWLRDRLKSAVIYELRDAFPLENPDTDGQGTRGPAVRRCFDGLRFLEALPGRLTTDQKALQTALRDDMDALADLVVAEAVHHRTAGAADVASAWLRVLSGGPIPHRPEFLRTHRSGHASDYRVTLVLPQISAATSGTPLRRAEYALAALLDQQTPDLNNAEVSAQIWMGDEVIHELLIQCEKDMGLDAIHIAKLGEEPLKRRLEAFVLSDFHAKVDMIEVTKRGWVLDREGLEAAGLTITLHLDDIAADLTRASDIWQMAHAGQPLSPGDLSNAANPATPLDEAAHVATLTTAAADMWARVTRLHGDLNTERDEYSGLLNSIFKNIARFYENPGMPWGRDERLDADVRKNVAKLHGLLDRLQRLNLDGTDTRPAAQRLVEDMVGREADLRRPLAELDQRKATVKAAQAARITNPETLAEVRADLKSAMTALRLCVGMEELALFPSLLKSTALTPLLQGAEPAETALGPWPRYRARLARLLDMIRNSHAGHKVHPDATADDKNDPNADTRDEARAPRAYHHGLFLAAGLDMNASTISGIVVDEWVEKRPSTQQDAAIALNYDSPQAEAPNSLILAVPEDPYAPGWSAERAADMVRHMLDLMQMRALSTQTTPLDNTILPLSNLVAHLGSGAGERPRLPEAKYQAGLKNWFATTGQRLVVGDDELSVLGGSWNQTNLYGPKRKGTP